MSLTIHDFVRQEVKNYRTKEITVVDGYEFNQSETIRLVDLYTNSRFEGSQVDSNGKRKPFFNITTRILNKQRTAEEIDTKDISLETTRPQHYAKSFIMTLCNRMWMKKTNFADTLNQMTETRGKYGGLLVKRYYDDDGMMTIGVEDWNNIITDPVDIPGGVKIKRHYYTPAQLMNMKDKGWGTGEFEGSIEAAIQYASEKDQEREEEAEKRETMSEYIEVFEVHGVLPRSMVDENASEYDYSHQMHVIVDIDDHKGTLYQSDDSEEMYKYLPYRKASRRSLGIGLVEEAFESQIWTNDAVIKEKQAMDFAGKVIVHTDDEAFKKKNVFKHMKNGTIAVTKRGSRMNVVNMTPSGLQNFQNMVQAWDRQVANSTSVQDTNTGGQLPSATAFRSLAIQNQEANSIFELRREEMGIFLQEIYQDWVIPELRKYLKSSEFVKAKLSPEELEILQKDYVQKEADKRVTNNIIAGKYDEYNADVRWTMIQQDRDAMRSQVMEEVKKTKFFKVPEGYLDNVEFELDVVITNEQRIKQVYLESLVNILTTVSQNQAILQDPRLKKLFDQIMETAGFSPLEFDSVQPQELSETDLEDVQGEGGTEKIEAPKVEQEQQNVV